METMLSPFSGKAFVYRLKLDSHLLCSHQYTLAQELLICRILLPKYCSNFLHPVNYLDFLLRSKENLLIVLCVQFFYHTYFDLQQLQYGINIIPILILLCQLPYLSITLFIPVWEGWRGQSGNVTLCRILFKFFKYLLLKYTSISMLHAKKYFIVKNFIRILP